MGSLKQVPHTRIDNLSFRVYSDEEIEKISVIEIKKDESFNSLGHYFDEGIYDLHMGPMSSKDQDICKTCNNQYFRCSGHFGHISLPCLVYNPVFVDVLKELLTRVCPSCFRFQAGAKREVEFYYENKFLNAGYDQVDVHALIQRALNNPIEACESMMNEESEGRLLNKKKETPKTINEIGNIINELEREFTRIKNSQEPYKQPTCNTQAVYTKYKKKFLNDSKPRNKICLYCSGRLLQLKYQDSKFMIKNAEKDDEARGGGGGGEDSLISRSQPYLTADQAKEILQNCYANDSKILTCLYPVLEVSNSTNLFFLKKLLVSPPKYRPCNRVKGQLVENETSVLYKYILRWSNCLKYLKLKTNESEMPEAIKFIVKELKGDTIFEKRFRIMCLLQAAVDNILDSDINKLQRIAYKGIRQIIEKKFGLFRRNLMGKRVNYSARSVAAPDPMLGVDEVGVPIEFAMKLTYPVPVTSWNISKLRKLVQNGPKCFPGAVMVEDEEGRKVTLKAEDLRQRDAISRSLLTQTESCVKKVNATKIVYRHLDNGDYVLMNRQPTLHKPSIQAHKVRVMANDRVLRMPYANCKAYNADFDGDELNLHFSQNEMARSEAKHIITTRNQYLTPKDGSPLAGLIQDCIVASVMLTVRGKFFNKEDYQQLVFISLSELPHKIRLLKPAILKPQQLWSGKQIISTILLNLIPESKAKPTFNFRTTVKVYMWQNQKWRLPRCGGGGTAEKLRESMTESEFVMRQGELVCGVIDKCAIGSTSYGLVHVCYDLYGGHLATQVLTSIGRICVSYLQWVGHTISLKEFVTSEEAANERRTSLKNLIEGTKLEICRKLGVGEDELEAHIESVHKSENEKEMSVIDAAYTNVLGPTTSDIIKNNEGSLLRNNLQNRMRMMIDTGAKGSRVNMNQMASLFGSVAIDGKRMPMSATGKTLPSFKPYECDPRAGGYIPTRFVTGMEPRSYFFLCIVGRDSLQHTAVKTANSGYMQRCLIKHLEGIRVGYDMTVRNSDGVVLQFEYGEDGLDVTKVPFLQNVNTIDAIMDTLLEEYNYPSTDKKAKELALSTYSPEIEKKKRMIKRYIGNDDERKRIGGFLNFSSEHADLEGPSANVIGSKGRTENTLHLMKLWCNLPQKMRERYQKQEKRRKECMPISSMYNGSSQFGVVSEVIDKLIDEYYEEKYCLRREEEQKLTKEQKVSEEEKKKAIKSVLYMKAMKSQIDPGEAVGALCAQAIGEPLTQMTLNTFHFAGRDELNVTLGVPRMIEILRTASEKIKTPIMEVPFKPGVSKSLTQKLKVRLTPVPLDKVMSHVDITSSLELQPTLIKRYVVKFSIHPYNVYKKVYYSRPEVILRYMEKFYFRRILIKHIKAAISKVKPYSGSAKKIEEEEQEKEKEMVSENQMSKRGLEEDDSEDEDDPAETNEQTFDDGISGMGRQGKQAEQDYSEDESDDSDGDDSNNEDGDETDRRDKGKTGRQKIIKKEPLSDENELPDEAIDANEEQEMPIDISEADVPMTPLLTYASKKAMTKLLTEQRWKSSQLQDHDLENIVRQVVGESLNNLPSAASGKSKKGNKGSRFAPSNEYLIRKNKVMCEDRWIVDYDYDDESSLWCQLTLTLPIAEGRYDLASIIKQTTSTTEIYSISGIKKAYVVEKNDGFLLRTEGVNMRGICTYEDILDINKIYTNNIHVMANTYGIEAAQRAIIKEIVEVQKAYSIKVNFRHLSLLADYFTCEGVYKACSRFALDTCASPIQKMSYETCFNFLKKALLQDFPDHMDSPSANVAVGQPVKVGTNSMEILSKLS